MAPSQRLLALALASLPGCFLSDRDETPPPPDAPEPVPLGCISWQTRETKHVAVSGTLIDLATQAPVGGATVDIATAWDVEGLVPRPECPLLATVVTGSDGRFGPLMLDAGSSENPPILAFMVHDGDRAPTMFDSRAKCVGANCDPLDVTIPAASRDLDLAWRVELANGGMPYATSRALVAFKFKNTDQTGAAGVVPYEGVGVVRNMTPGTEVRFLATDLTTILPTTQTTTTDSGIALVGMDYGVGRIDIGGRRGAESWPGLGCLTAAGLTFFEDKTVSPML